MLGTALVPMKPREFSLVVLEFELRGIMRDDCERLCRHQNVQVYSAKVEVRQKKPGMYTISRQPAFEPSIQHYPRTRQHE